MKPVILILSLLSCLLSLPAQQEGMLIPWESHGKWGYADSSGIPRLEPRFDFAWPFQANKLALVRFHQRYGLIGPQGQWVAEPRFGAIRDFSENFAPAYIDEAWGFIDTTGNWAIRPRFDFAGNFMNGIALVMQNDSWFFISDSGKPIFEKEYPALRNFAGNYAAAMADDGQWGFIDRTGNWVIMPQYQAVGDFSDGFAAVRDSLWFFIDENGNRVGEGAFLNVTNFNDGLAGVGYNYKWGYIDTTGTFVIEPVYRGGGGFSEGFAPVKVDRKWGFINPADSVVIPYAYDYAFAFYNGKAAVVVNSKYGFIDSTGWMLVGTEYDQLGYYQNGLARANKAGMTGWLTESGNWISSDSGHIPWIFPGNRIIYLVKDIKSGKNYQLTLVIAETEPGLAMHFNYNVKDFPEGILTILPAARDSAFAVTNFFAAGETRLADRTNIWLSHDLMAEIRQKAEISFEVDGKQQSFAVSRVDEPALDVQGGKFELPVYRLGGEKLTLEVIDLPFQPLLRLVETPMFNMELQTIR